MLCDSSEILNIDESKDLSSLAPELKILLLFAKLLC